MSYSTTKTSLSNPLHDTYRMNVYGLNPNSEYDSALKLSSRLYNPSQGNGLNLSKRVMEGQQGSSAGLNFGNIINNSTGFNSPDSSSKIGAGKLQAGMAAGASLAEGVSGIVGFSKEDAGASINEELYNSESNNMPQDYSTQANPYKKGRGGSTFGKKALTYSSTGASLGGPWGAVIGAGVAGIEGLITGGINKKKRRQFKDAQDRQRRRYLAAMGSYMENKSRNEIESSRRHDLSDRGVNMNDYYNATAYNI